MSEPPVRRDGQKLRDDDARGTPPGRGIITPAHGGRIGNPPFVPTEEQRQRVRTYAKAFPPCAQHYIARLLGVSVDTLQKYFHADLEMGRAELIASCAAQEIAYALDADSKLAKGNQSARQFVLMKMGMWGRPDPASPGGGAPEEETFDLTNVPTDAKVLLLQQVNILLEGPKGSIPDAGGSQQP